MSVKPAFIALAIASQAALTAGCATIDAPFGAKDRARTADSDGAEKPLKRLQTEQPKIDKRARAAIGREDVLTQMTFWAREQSLYPDDLEAAIKFAEALRAGGRPERAVEVAAAGLDAHADSRDLLRVYGLALLDAGRGGQALTPLALLCESDAKDWRARSALGVALDGVGRFDEARQAYKEALAIKPDDVGVLTNLGVSYLLSGEAAKAESILKQAAALPGAGPQTRQNLALAVGLQGRFAEAEQLQKVDLPPALVANNMDYLHTLLRDDRRWGAPKKKMQ